MIRRSETQFVDEEGFVVEEIQVVGGYIRLRERSRIERILDEAPARIKRTPRVLMRKLRQKLQQAVQWLLQLFATILRSIVGITSNTPSLGRLQRYIAIAPAARHAAAETASAERAPGQD